MDPGRIAARVLIAYVYLLIVTRASGKRVVTQASTVDLLVSLIIGDLIDDVLWAEVSAAKFAVGAGSVALADVITKVAGYSLPAFDRLVNGASRVVLRDGRELRDELRREKINEEELAALLRIRGIDRGRWDEVHLAVVETDEQMAVILDRRAERATRSDAANVKELVR
jgi:uncharacterized membrane protein YcaP (DUF421 family)